MPSLQSVAKEFSVSATYEELCDAGSRERLALTLLNDQGAWNGLDPDQVALGHLIRVTLADAATAARKAFGPGARFRVVLELLTGTPHGDRIEYASSRSEIVTD
ncbi:MULTISPECIES: hypothetical protein [unclassified Streptomyces]|uniref:hypothetical protein n=1 Tax=unclassified Streptomyces TaxID=2593676 RepID=UPI0033217320